MSTVTPSVAKINVHPFEIWNLQNLHCAVRLATYHVSQSHARLAICWQSTGHIVRIRLLRLIATGFIVLPHTCVYPCLSPVVMTFNRSLNVACSICVAYRRKDEVRSPHQFSYSPICATKGSRMSVVRLDFWYTQKRTIHVTWLLHYVNSIPCTSV